MVLRKQRLVSADALRRASFAATQSLLTSGPAAVSHTKVLVLQPAVGLAAELCGIAHSAYAPVCVRARKPAAPPHIASREHRFISADALRGACFAAVPSLLMCVRSIIFCVQTPVLQPAVGLAAEHSWVTDGASWPVRLDSVRCTFRVAFLQACSRRSQGCQLCSRMCLQPGRRGLDANQLSGSLPSSLGNLTGLTSLYVMLMQRHSAARFSRGRTLTVPACTYLQMLPS